MIKVYFANTELLHESEVFAKCFEVVHPMRQKKVLRHKLLQDRRRSLLAGLLLKLALEREGLCYEQLDFEIEIYGKPVLKNVKDLHFSLSHAGDLALCCISDQIVGVDVEGISKSIFKTENIERMQVVGKKMFSEVECAKFEQGDEEQKIQMFLNYWTRKESYSKALGEGLRMKFSDIDTENMGNVFWSDWLEKDYFISIYSMQNECTDIEFHQILELEI